MLPWEERSSEVSYVAIYVNCSEVYILSRFLDLVFFLKKYFLSAHGLAIDFLNVFFDEMLHFFEVCLFFFNVSSLFISCLRNFCLSYEGIFWCFFPLALAFIFRFITKLKLILGFNYEGFIICFSFYGYCYSSPIC